MRDCETDDARIESARERQRPIQSTKKYFEGKYLTWESSSATGYLSGTAWQIRRDHMQDAHLARHFCVGSPEATLRA
jgi:hypothetical protein